MMKDWPTGANLNMDQFWNVYMKPYFVGAKLCINAADCGYPENLDYVKWSGGFTWNLLSSSSRILFHLNDGTIIFFREILQIHKEILIILLIFILTLMDLKSQMNVVEMFFIS